VLHICFFAWGANDSTAGTLIFEFLADIGCTTLADIGCTTCVKIKLLINLAVKFSVSHIEAGSVLGVSDLCLSPGKLLKAGHLNDIMLKLWLLITCGVSHICFFTRGANNSTAGTLIFEFLADIGCTTLADIGCTTLADIGCTTLADIGCTTLADIGCTTCVKIKLLINLAVKFSVSQIEAGSVLGVGDLCLSPGQLLKAGHLNDIMLKLWLLFTCGVSHICFFTRGANDSTAGTLIFEFLSDIGCTTLADIGCTTLADIGCTTLADIGCTTLADISCTTCVKIESLINLACIVFGKSHHRRIGVSGG
jgi:hypothetical protein